MSFFKRIILDGIGKGISDAIGKAVQKKVEPKANELADKAAEQLVESSARLDKANEQLKQASADYQSILDEWKDKLPQYPVWPCGGNNFQIEEIDGVYYFTACFEDSLTAKNAVKSYAQVLLQSGYRPKNDNLTDDNFYKTINGKCYYVDLEHCFDSDDSAPTIGFCVT